MAKGVLAARISPTEITIEECIEMVGGDANGAVVSFSGVVRDHDVGRSVVELEYEAHPTAEDQLAAAATAIAEAFPAVTISVVHRVGLLRVGELALACAVAAPHRDEAFAACAQLVDEIKASVPIWKEQRFTDGSAEWVGSLG